MRNQTKYLFIYLCVLCLLIGSVVRLAQARESIDDNTQIELTQAELEQILAPIALYPDTLLSHILVASTYPLEVVQAARWRAANEDLNEQQALDAVENKNWDPSVQALVPFHELIQKLSADLEWLQALGSAFLINEERLLSSVQNLRYQAYEEGHLSDSEYLDIEHEDGEIVIETVRKEVVYVPYYDTRVVYGNWRWHHHQPHFWHRPVHSVFRSGFYWSIGFNIRPSFYFGGFHWRNRHLVTNYHYRSHVGKHWSHNKRHQRVKVKEFQRWSHNSKHRRGVHYKVNGQHVVVRNSHGKKHYTVKGSHKTNKQRVLNVNKYAQKNSKNNIKRVKQNLNQQKQRVSDKQFASRKVAVSNKQRIINQQKSQQRQTVKDSYKTSKVAKFESKQRSEKKSQHYQTSNRQTDQKQRTSYKSHNTAYKQKSSNKSYRTSSNKQNKSRPVKIARNSERR